MTSKIAALNLENLMRLSMVLTAINSDENRESLALGIAALLYDEPAREQELQEAFDAGATWAAGEAAKGPEHQTPPWALYLSKTGCWRVRSAGAFAAYLATKRKEIL